MLEFIPTWIWGVLLALGVFAFLFKGRIYDMIGGIGTSAGIKKQYFLLAIIGFSILMGGLGVISGVISGASTASVTGHDVVSVDALTGLVTVKMHDGLVNATTTSDYLNNDEDAMTFYVTDANIDDGEEILFNVTIERELISEDANIKVTCSIPDQEIDGITASNLAEKTSGKIDLDINDDGTYTDKNTVYKNIAFSEGTSSAEVQIAFDQEETYEDGMTPYDNYVEVNCDAAGVPFKAIVYAAD